MAVGTYTGDGAATQAITGVGFQPVFVFIYAEQNLQNNCGYKSDQDGLFTRYFWAGGTSWRWELDHIISLDADGFTVGDGTGGIANTFNVNGWVYSYVAFG